MHNITNAAAEKKKCLDTTAFRSDRGKHMITHCHAQKKPWWYMVLTGVWIAGSNVTEPHPFVRVCVCVCCFCFLVCEQKRACFASSKSMSPRGNVEPETECERDRASPGQTHFALFPLSNFSVFTHRFLQISVKMLNYHSGKLTSASSYVFIRVRNLDLAPLRNLRSVSRDETVHML